MTRRLTSPQSPSVQLALAPIVNSVASAIAPIPSGPPLHFAPERNRTTRPSPQSAAVRDRPLIRQKGRWMSRLWRHRFADPQATAPSDERMVLDQAGRCVQVVGFDQRISADTRFEAAVGYAPGRYGLRSSERGARVDHVVAHAGDPGAESGHHLLAGLG